MSEPANNAGTLRDARKRRKLTRESIEIILERMKISNTPSEEIAEVKAILDSWERPATPRQPGLLQRQGAAWNFVRSHRKKFKATPSRKEIVARFLLTEKQADAARGKSVNKRISDEAKRLLALNAESALSESADLFDGVNSETRHSLNHQPAEIEDECDA